ncbi:MAG: hypothetical protein ACON4Z_09110 [Planctomycetota bacterium]
MTASAAAADERDEARRRRARCWKAGAGSVAIRVVMLALVLAYAPLEIGSASALWLGNLPAVALALHSVWNGAIAWRLGGRSPALVWGCGFASVSALASFFPPFVPLIVFF